MYVKSKIVEGFQGLGINVNTSDDLADGVLLLWRIFIFIGSLFIISFIIGNTVSVFCESFREVFYHTEQLQLK